jgi:osmotically inducible lipoprotein OsmB
MGAVVRNRLPLALDQAEASDHQRLESLTMKTTQRFTFSALAAAMLLGLGACAGMSHQDKSTAVGAGVGAVGGAVLTGGSAIGTVGGAAVGGVIGHEVGKTKN